MSNKRTLKPSSFSCPLTAAHHVGHQYGVERFADETGQSRAVVYNKLNPDNDSNHLYLRDAILLTEKSCDGSILEAWCHKLGGVFVRLPAVAAGDEELADQMMRLNEVLGSAMCELRTARKDGVIDPTEFELIKEQLMSTVNEALALNSMIKGQVRELPKRTA